MAQPIVMPSFGMYTAEGTLVNWLQPDGARVKQGEPILEIETEKAINPVPAPADGILHHAAKIGARLQEQALIGYILADGEPPPASGQTSAPNAQLVVGRAVPSAPPGEVAKPSGALGTARPTKAISPGPPPEPQTPARLKASPLARRLAAESRLELARLQGTGPGGRIVEADITAELARRKAGESAIAGLELRVLRRSALNGRRALADRFGRDLRQPMPLTITREVETELLVAARRSLSERLGSSVPFDVFFIKCFAAALRERPELNSMVQEDEVLVLDDIHLGFVAGRSGGMVVPVIREADRLPLAEISRLFRELAERARAGQIQPAEEQGGTATLLNLGAHGVDAFTPMLHWPQSCCLGMGRAVPRPVLRDGALAATQVRMLSLSFDQRAADAVEAAALLDAMSRRLNDENLLKSLL